MPGSGLACSDTKTPQKLIHTLPKPVNAQNPLLAPGELSQHFNPPGVQACPAGTQVTPDSHRSVKLDQFPIEQ